MFTLLTIPLMATLSRLSGGGLFAPQLAVTTGMKGIPEIFFGLCIAAPFFHYSISLGLAMWIYSWAVKESGHDNTLYWGKDIRIQDLGKTAKTTFIVDWLAKRLRISLYKEDGISRSLNYCRLFMAFKGFLIGLPMFPLGLLLIIFHPLSYEIQEKHIKKDGLEEWLSGGFAGLIRGVTL